MQCSSPPCGILRLLLPCVLPESMHGSGSQGLAVASCNQAARGCKVPVTHPRPECFLPQPTHAQASAYAVSHVRWLVNAYHAVETPVELISAMYAGGSILCSGIALCQNIHMQCSHVPAHVCSSAGTGTHPPGQTLHLRCRFAGQGNGQE